MFNLPRDFNISSHLKLDKRFDRLRFDTHLQSSAIPREVQKTRWLT